ncbi:galectin-3-binding protein-like [Mya arenaria]|uniref:galectin-3-binding protein-like n=1 Tax=Mya arenaria TaxID=6604 RepID=UPI0022E90861|nr:galectin-3-binding protein-like [Mya arenaria]
MQLKLKFVAITRAVFCLICIVSSAKSQPQWDLSDLDIRLADGNSVLDGRVERRINGVWGTVCNNVFDIKDAQVICTMLSGNLTALQVIRDGRYGQGQGPIFYDRLGCSGTELSIDDCYSITGEQCLHNQDVAIVCSGNSCSVFCASDRTE